MKDCLFFYLQPKADWGAAGCPKDGAAAPKAGVAGCPKTLVDGCCCWPNAEIWIMVIHFHTKFRHSKFQK